MCGIIGYITNSDNQNLEKKFDFYFNQQNHRGPDYKQKLKFSLDKNNVCLGFNRLSIIDTSPNSNKIFNNNDYSLLFNGEIYNFLYLKKKYLCQHKLETNTDTEVLFNLLILKKEKIFEELEGMFSIVFLNKKNKTLLLSRDYTGIKPLYYSVYNHGIFFSSEAWFQYSISNRELDFDKLNFFFKFGFNHYSSTLIKNVKKVCPSEYIIFDIREKKIEKKKYFSLKKQSEKNDIDSNNFQTLIDDVIKKNLISDRKVGVFLSGGIDSAVIALTAKKFNPNIEAFTSYFEPENNFKKFNFEIEYAEKLAKYLGIRLNKCPINTNSKTQKDELINLILSFDEPLANLNSFNSYFQSKKASENDCRVVLTGDGADEIFGGYERYKKIFIAQKLKVLSIFNKKIKIINGISTKNIPSYFYDYLNPPKYKKIFCEDIVFDSIKLDLPDDLNKINTMNHFDLNYWLPEESNFKLDRTSMINSVEGRVPFQDVQLLNKIYPIDYNKKNTFFENKIFFKKYIKDIPKFITKRKKHGWFSPESFYLRNYLKDFFFETFNEEDIKKQKIFNTKEVYKLYDDHYSKKKYYKNQILSLLSFQAWYNKVLNIL